MPGDGMPAGRAGDGRGAAEGFTLVEMLAALAVLSLALTLGFRSMGGMNASQRPARLSGMIAAEIGLLRAEALRSGRGGHLVFEPGTGRFLSSRPGAAPIAAPLHVTVEAADAEGARPGEIRFLPDGSSTGGRIVLQGASARLALTVSALTGRVRRDEIR